MDYSSYNVSKFIILILNIYQINMGYVVIFHNLGQPCFALEFIVISWVHCLDTSCNVFHQYINVHEVIVCNVIYSFWTSRYKSDLRRQFVSTTSVSIPERLVEADLNCNCVKVSIVLYHGWGGCRLPLVRWRGSPSFTTPTHTGHLASSRHPTSSLTRWAAGRSWFHCVLFAIISIKSAVEIFQSFNKRNSYWFTIKCMYYLRPWSFLPRNNQVILNGLLLIETIENWNR